MATLTEKRAVVVLNVGDKDQLHPKSRESMKHAAKRWGADFIEITTPTAPVHPYWQKTFIIEKVQEYDRVLQLDADMLINSACPNIFEIVAPDEVGVVSAHQYLQPNWIQSRNACVRWWANRLGVKTPPDERHLNGGFFLYSPKHHLDVFRELQEHGANANFTSSYLPEQACLSVMLWNNQRVKQRWLPHKFNVLGPLQLARSNRHGPRMRGYIYHYTGGNKEQRISNTWWNKVQWEPVKLGRTKEILALLPRGGPVTIAEVGVLRGNNAAALLHRRADAHLYLVDCWAEHPSDGTYVQSQDGNARWTNDDWKMIMHEAIDKLDLFHGRYNILQLPSTTACRAFDDESLDMVFIDADHSYEACLADIKAWWPKVKPGGWIGGHDFAHSHPKWGVTKAVKEFFSGHKAVKLGCDFTWFARK